MSKQTALPAYSLRRYVLTGAALGLYFGLFFRPLRQPNLALSIVLALLIMVLLTVLKLFRERRELPKLSALLKYMVMTFVKALVALILLEMRHFAYLIGGRVATTIFSVVAGGLVGAWFAWDQKRLRAAQAQEDL